MAKDGYFVAEAQGHAPYKLPRLPNQTNTAQVIFSALRGTKNTSRLMFKGSVA
jgi:hypothetical protein